jgi:hypothetical protein
MAMPQSMAGTRKRRTRAIELAFDKVEDFIESDPTGQERSEP